MSGAVLWARRNLFRNPLDAIITVVAAFVVGYVLYRLGRFVFVTGRWDIVRDFLKLFLVGRYEADDLWRPALALVAATGFGGLVAGTLRSGRVAPITATAADASAVANPDNPLAAGDVVGESGVVTLNDRAVAAGDEPAHGETSEDTDAPRPWWRSALGVLDRLWPVLGATALLLSLTTTVGPSLVAAAAAVAAVLGYAAGRTLPVNGIKLVGGLGAVAGAGYFAYVDPFDWLPGKFPGPRSIVQVLTMLGWVLALAAIALAVGWLVSLVVQRVARVSEASSASLAAMVIGVAATATFLAVDPLGVVPDIPYVSLINIWLGLVACVIGLVLLATMVLAGNPTGALAALGLFGSLAMLILLTEPTGWDEWGGMMLNIFLAVVSISLCFPIGVMLALGRRSEMPLVRAISTGYIELFRGVPLYVLLVMAGVPLTLFIPRTVAPGSVARAIIVFTLFTAAYVAEIVRGGLQSLPRGQTEAGQALGMPGRRITAMIVLPQALRNVIPATVGQFISLFKDTTLAGSALSFIDLLGAYDVATSEFQGQRLFGEAISFVMLLFWVGSITMSRESQRLERKLGVGTR